MQGRGGSYGWNNGYGHPPSHGQYHGHSGYSQYNQQQAQGYPPHQASYGQHHAQHYQQHGHNYAHGSSQSTAGPHQAQYGSHGGSYNSSRGSSRGTPTSKASRGQYGNLSWRPTIGTRANRPPDGGQQDEMKSVIAAPPPQPQPDTDDIDNPFRPPANLRAEDEEAAKARKQAEREAAAAKSEADTDDVDDQNKISFSIKLRPGKAPPEAAPVPKEPKLSPLSSKKVPMLESPLTASSEAPKSKHYQGNTKIDPAKSASRELQRAVRKQIVKRKVLKQKPTMAEEHSQSESVYFRKTGNESVVGSGTYGKVYKATHVYTGKMVALKKIRMEGERDGFPVTAIREIKLLQSLRHSNVVPLREVMVERNDCYMVFEYLHHDLTGLLNHPTFILSPAHKKHLAKQMFEGLEYLHRRGVLHRDIKAANILISKSGELKLADFGLARFYQKRSKEDYTNRVITIWYRPPELLLGETQYDGAVDIWSAACVLVEIFLRHAIFPGNGSEIDQLDKIYSVLGTPSRSEWPGIVEQQWYELLRPSQRIPSTFAEKYRDRVSPEGFELLQAMFAYDPANRPTAADVLQHAYFVSEEPAPAQAVELEHLEGDWHEFESKQLRKEKERQERKRREREREGEKRKRDESAGGDAKKAKLAADTTA